MFCNCSTLGIFGKIQTYHTNNQPIEHKTFLNNAKKPITCCNNNSSKFSSTWCFNILYE